MTTRSSASRKWPSTTIIPAGGKAGPCCTISSISISGMPCRRPTSLCCAPRPRWRTSGCRQNMTPPIRRRSSGGGGRRAAAAVHAADHGCLAARGARPLCGRVQDQRRLQEGLGGDACLPQRPISVVASRRADLRQLSRSQPHPHLTAVERTITRRRRGGPEFFSECAIVLGWRYTFRFHPSINIEFLRRCPASKKLANGQGGTL